MITKNPRINVTFEETTAQLLANLAHNQHKSVAGLVRELALEALDLREDMYLSNLAAALDVQEARTYSHGDVWK